MRRWCGPCGLGFAVTLSAAPAAAQTADGFDQPAPLALQYQRDQAGTVLGDPSLSLPITVVDTRPVVVDPAIGVAVGDRPRPDYDSAPMPVGPFLLSGTLTQDIAYDSNVYRQRNARSDAYSHTELDATLTTNMTRHLLKLNTVLAEQAYTRLSSEDGFTYKIDGGGRLDLGERDSLALNAGYAHQLSERSSATEVISTKRPVRQNVANVGLDGHKELGRFAVNIGLSALRQDYEDAQTPDGRFVDESYRNHHTYGARLDVGYAPGPGPTLYMAFSTQFVRYGQRIGGLNRDSNQYTVIAGIRGEISPLLRGSLGVGYLTARIQDGRSGSGATVEAQLEYLATEQTTLSLDASRAFLNVGSPTTPLSIDTRFNLRVDHELLRNLILHAAAAYEVNDYIKTPGGTTGWSLDGGANWLLTRHLRAHLDFGYRKSNGSGLVNNRTFDEKTAMAGISIQL